MNPLLLLRTVVWNTNAETSFAASAPARGRRRRRLLDVIGHTITCKAPPPVTRSLAAPPPVTTPLEASLTPGSGNGWVISPASRSFSSTRPPATRPLLDARQARSPAAQRRSLGGVRRRRRRRRWRRQVLAWREGRGRGACARRAADVGRGCMADGGAGGSSQTQICKQASANQGSVVKLRSARPCSLCAALAEVHSKALVCLRRTEQGCRNVP
jgi:hypothetical protein